MKNKGKKWVAKIFRDIADKIDKGECGMEDEELMAVASTFIHRKMYQEPMCKYYGFTRATLERWVKSGKLPEPRRDGNGRIFWWLDECEEYIERWNEEHEEQN